MKSILKKVVGIAVAVTLAFGMISCSDPVVSAGPDYSKCVVGDFILKDGTVLSKDTDLTADQKQNVAAVIVRAAADGKPALGVGIVHEKLAWCNEYSDSSNTTKVLGYITKIETLLGEITSGYMDGSNSWAILVEACEDLKNATAETIETVAQNYPAFNYCRKYGTTNGLTGALKNGWYLPTVAELHTIYQNQTTVNVSLSKTSGSKFGTKFYLSCCQGVTAKLSSHGLHFSDGDPCNSIKSSNDFVCAVRAFK